MQRVAADYRQREGAVNQAAGQQSPEEAEQERVAARAYRQQRLDKSRQRLPQAAAVAFQAAQQVDAQSDLQANGKHHQRSGEAQRHRPRRAVVAHADEWQQATEDEAERGVAGEPPAVIDRQQPLFHAAEAERNADAAAHGDAVRAAGKPGGEGSEEGGGAHDSPDSRWRRSSSVSSSSGIMPGDSRSSNWRVRTAQWKA